MSDVPNLADRPSDYIQIHHALMRYTHGVDRCDLAALKSSFWPDATCNYRGEPVSAHEWATNTVTAIKGMLRTHHNVTNYLIEFTGENTARCEVYVIAYHQMIQAEERAFDVVVGGRYIDRHERRGGEWRILSRHYLMDWNQNVPATDTWASGFLSSLNRGGRMPDDEYYRQE